MTFKYILSPPTGFAQPEQPIRFGAKPASAASRSSNVPFISLGFMSGLCDSAQSVFSASRSIPESGWSSLVIYSTALSTYVPSVSIV